MLKRIFLVMLVLFSIVLSACSPTGNIVRDGSEICIPKYDVNGNDLNKCGAVVETEDDSLGDLDKLLSEIERDMNAEKEDDVAKEEVIVDVKPKEDPKPAPKEEVKTSEDGLLVKTVTEGDLVELKPRVSDPDGDEILLTFSYPLDEEGKWYTKEGDAGSYDVKISASDGKTVSSQTVRIIVNAMNKAPVITIADELTFNEGDKITLSPDVKDPEGEKVSVTYSGFMTSNTYQTTYEDAGEYFVTITATDGKKESSKIVKVIVRNTNRAPVIENMDKIVVTEEDLIAVVVSAYDPDGDEVTISFDMPLNSEGEWQTKVGDEGDYKLEVVASDGNLEARKEVEVIVEAKNKAPVLQRIPEITVNEGETVVISPVAIDPEGEELSFSYSGWMTSNTYKTNNDDSGSYVVKVTVSDGVHDASQDVKITVVDVNRAPEFGCLVNCD